MLVEITSRVLEQLPGVYQVELPDFLKAKVLGEGASPAPWDPVPCEVRGAPPSQTLLWSQGAGGEVACPH